MSGNRGHAGTGSGIRWYQACDCRAVRRCQRITGPRPHRSTRKGRLSPSVRKAAIVSRRHSDGSGMVLSAHSGEMIGPIPLHKIHRVCHFTADQLSHLLGGFPPVHFVAAVTLDQPRPPLHAQPVRTEIGTSRGKPERSRRYAASTADPQTHSQTSPAKIPFLSRHLATPPTCPPASRMLHVG
jgi:hypothetical protein